jgi:hypothetical protein
MDEEIRMRKYVSDFLQLLYIESQRRLGPTATTAENKTVDYFSGPYQPKDDRSEMPVHRILAYPMLKGVKSIPRVTEEVFFSCLPQTMHVLEEFSKQLERFRQLSARHVDKYGTMNFDEALLTKPVGDAYYGTRTNRNSEAYLKKIAAII